MKVLFMCNEGAGLVDYIEIDEGTSIKDFISTRAPGKARDYLIKVNRQVVGSESMPTQYLLQENDRVTMYPKYMIQPQRSRSTH